MSRTVLLIDDDPVFTETVATLLTTKLGARVLRAANGTEAIRHLDAHENQLALILCDLNMPDCDGIEVVEELGRRRVKTPIIFVTGAVKPIVKSAEALARVHGLRVVSTLIKPIRFPQLFAAAIDILGEAWSFEPRAVEQGLP